MAEQAYDCDTKGMRLADLADGLLNGVWASDCATAGECGGENCRIKEFREIKR
jgi:hypothetical protein